MPALGHCATGCKLEHMELSFLSLAITNNKECAGQVLMADGPHRLTVVAVVVVPIHVARKEVQVSRVDRVVRIERAGPIVTVGANVVEVRVVAVPNCGKKECWVFRQSSDTDGKKNTSCKPVAVFDCFTGCLRSATKTIQSNEVLRSRGYSRILHLSGSRRLWCPSDPVAHLCTTRSANRMPAGHFCL